MYSSAENFLKRHCRTSMCHTKNNTAVWAKEAGLGGKEGRDDRTCTRRETLLRVPCPESANRVSMPYSPGSRHLARPPWRRLISGFLLLCRRHRSGEDRQRGTRDCVTRWEGTSTAPREYGQWRKAEIPNSERNPAPCWLLCPQFLTSSAAQRRKWLYLNGRNNKVNSPLASPGRCMLPRDTRPLPQARGGGVRVPPAIAPLLSADAAKLGSMAGCTVRGRKGLCRGKSIPKLCGVKR